MKFNALSKILVSLIVPAFLATYALADTYKVGVVGAYSGDLASYGLPIRHATTLAAEKINAAGGVNGQQIELVFEDDVCEPNVATSVATKLVGDNVDAVIGHLCSGATEAALPIYREAGVVVISGSATNPPLTLNGDNPHFFRTISHDAAQANLQVEYAISKMKIKSAAVLHDKGAYGQGLASLADKALKERGIDVAVFEGVTPGQVDYSAVLRKIKRANVDVVIYGGYHPEASKLITQARQKRIMAPFISGDGVKDPVFLKIAGRYAEGYYVTAPLDVSQVNMADEVTKVYKERFKQDIGTFSLQGYAALQALANAFGKAESTSVQDMKAVLTSEEVQTPLGRISFDQSGDVVGAGFTMYIVKNGEFVAAP